LLPFLKTAVGFKMKYFEELNEEISEILGTSVGALKASTIMP
jgi:hypothetical protein